MHRTIWTYNQNDHRFLSWSIKKYHRRSLSEAKWVNNRNRVQNHQHLMVLNSVNKHQTINNTNFLQSREARWGKGHHRQIPCHRILEKRNNFGPSVSRFAYTRIILWKTRIEKREEWNSASAPDRNNMDILRRPSVQDPTKPRFPEANSSPNENYSRRVSWGQGAVHIVPCPDTRYAWSLFVS